MHFLSAAVEPSSARWRREVTRVEYLGEDHGSDAWHH